MAPNAYLTVGISGCGKSYWASARFNDIVKNGGAIAIINLDNCRKIVSGDESDQACTPEAVKYQKYLIDQCIEWKDDMIISDTNLNPRFRNELIKKLESCGYDVFLKIFTTSFDVCKERNDNRDRRVPDHAMEKMYKSFQDQFPGMMS